MTKYDQRSQMGICVASDCDAPAYVIIQQRTCKCSQSQVSCLNGHVALITLMLHKGPHGEVMLFDEDDQEVGG